MQKFNLEKAKEGQKVMTKGGDPVRIVCYDVKNNYLSILALITNEDGKEEARFYTKGGTSFRLGSESNFDLVMVPRLRQAWINIYSFARGSFRYETREEAVENIADKDDYVDTIRIEWTE